MGHQMRHQWELNRMLWVIIIIAATLLLLLGYRIVFYIFFTFTFNKKYYLLLHSIICAHTLIVVALIVVRFFSFLRITRHHKVGLGRNLVQMILTGLPELFEHDIANKNSREYEKTIFSKT